MAQSNVQEEIRARFESGRRAEQREEFILAESEYRQALGLALTRLGAIASRLSEFPTAERAFRECIQAISTPEEGLMGLGFTYLRSGEYEKGVEVANRLIELNAFNRDARQLLGKLYLMQRKYEAAAHELQQANRSKEDLSTSYALALAYMNMGLLEEVRKLFDRMIELAGDTPEMHLLFGRAYREIRQVNLAHAEFRKALELNPQLPRVHYYLGLIYMSPEAEESRDLEKALEEFHLEAAARPDEFPPQFFLGMIYARERKFEDAIRHLKRAIELSPGSFRPQYYLGIVLSAMQRSQEAIIELEEAVNLPDSSVPDRDKASARYQLGQALRKAGRLEEAQKQMEIVQQMQRNTLEEDRARLRMMPLETVDRATGRELEQLEQTGLVLVEEPLTPVERDQLTAVQPVLANLAAAAYGSLAMLFAGGSDLPKVVDNLSKAIAWDDSMPDLHYNLGLAYFRQRKVAEAIPALERAVERDPKKAEAKRLLGIAAFMNKDFAKAADVLSEVAGNAPEKDPQTSYSLALALLQINRVDDASKIVDKLILAAPKIPELHVLKGQIYAQRQEYEPAIKSFDKALALKWDLPEANFFAGMAYLRQSAFDQAERRFELELKRDPNHIQARYHIAFIAVTKNEKDKAVELLMEVIRMNPQHAEALYELGKIQLEKGNTAPAVANLETAANLEPNKPYIFYQLYRAYMRVGRTEAAQRALSRYQKLKGRSP